MQKDRMTAQCFKNRTVKAKIMLGDLEKMGNYKKKIKCNPGTPKDKKC